MILVQYDLWLSMDRIPRVEERCEEHTRFPLLQDLLKEFIQNIT